MHGRHGWPGPKFTWSVEPKESGASPCRRRASLIASEKLRHLELLPSGTLRMLPFLPADSGSESSSSFIGCTARYVGPTRTSADSPGSEMYPSSWSESMSESARKESSCSITEEIAAFRPTVSGFGAAVVVACVAALGPREAHMRNCERSSPAGGRKAAGSGLDWTWPKLSERGPLRRSSTTGRPASRTMPARPPGLDSGFFRGLATGFVGFTGLPTAMVLMCKHCPSTVPLQWERYLSNSCIVILPKVSISWTGVSMGFSTRTFALASTWHMEESSLRIGANAAGEGCSGSGKSGFSEVIERVDAQESMNPGALGRPGFSSSTSQSVSAILQRSITQDGACAAPLPCGAFSPVPA
mmetsp:Transcript_59749/g.165166  ORF Transcript_59749/g.165166 Transcript_59749/m.165166 type:complete len:356 (-) Transcript_59749:142-1209(-)